MAPGEKGSGSPPSFRYVTLKLSACTMGAMPPSVRTSMPGLNAAPVYVTVPSAPVSVMSKLPLAPATSNTYWRSPL